MNPQKVQDDYKPRWRHFHPLDTVWVENPFDEVLSWQVADEHNVPHIYEIDPNGVAELPGGLIATLGVKQIVDRLITEDGKQVQMWDENLRKQYEDKIIKRFKPAPASSRVQRSKGGGRINLTSDSNVDAEQETTTPAPAPTTAPEPEPQPEEEFPELASSPSEELAKATSSLPAESQVDPDKQAG